MALARQVVIAVLLAGLLAPVTAQDNADPPGKADDAEARIVLQAPALTVKEALERRQAAMTEAEKAMEAAQAEYGEAEAAANRAAVADVSQIARRAVAAGDLAKAAEAWEAVLRLEPESKDAVAFFRTIGRTPPAETDTEPMFQRQALAGAWVGAWGTSGNSIQLLISRDGRTLKSHSRVWPIEQVESRFIAFEVMNETCELIADGDRLIVLGWSYAKGRDVQKESPNHVAILRRAR